MEHFAVHFFADPVGVLQIKSCCSRVLHRLIDQIPDGKHFSNRWTVEHLDQRIQTSPRQWRVLHRAVLICPKAVGARWSCLTEINPRSVFNNLCDFLNATIADLLFGSFWNMQARPQFIGDLWNFLLKSLDHPINSDHTHPHHQQHSRLRCQRLTGQHKVMRPSLSILIH